MNPEHGCPVSMVTRKQDIKSKSTRRSMQRVILDDGYPCILLGIHLCGTLSLRALDFFNNNSDVVKLLILKPCCFPPMLHAKRDETFHVGTHSFRATDVASNFRNYEWTGPPRADLLPKFISTMVPKPGPTFRKPPGPPDSIDPGKRWLLPKCRPRRRARAHLIRRALDERASTIGGWLE